MANKLVNEKQMTVRWHVDDLMISHVDKGEILKFVKCIKDIYGDNLVKNVGTVHDYLGMTFSIMRSEERCESTCANIYQV